ncbi:CPBP family intramembrane glutamic endopeptidase [Microbacterium sp. NPDC057650]|uniref:CPBP family intramembrane glutamic endopeptidase n=1 Tax=unclassified Microbacterium TaxID=2609290 RepID=UPI0036714366
MNTDTSTRFAALDFAQEPSFAYKAESGWQRFWNRGGWWRAVLVAVVYLALYLGAGRLTSALFADRIDPSDPLADPATVFFGTALPILIGSVILLVFGASLRWLPTLFGRQPVRGRGWMWIAPLVVVATALLRSFGTDFNRFSLGTVLTIFATGALIGLAEELLTRGFVVELLRRHGYTERVVMLLSALTFALLHSANLLTGQTLAQVLPTLGFTFVFGIAMYLTMRVTGSIVWAIVLHAITDPTTMLASGGIDNIGAHVSTLTTLSQVSLPIYVVLSIVALFLVKGRVKTQDAVLIA